MGEYFLGKMVSSKGVFDRLKFTILEGFLGLYYSECYGQQRCKLCRKLGRSFPVGLGTSSRILRGSPAVFVLSRNFAVTCAFFGLFWVNFPDFQHFLG